MVNKRILIVSVIAIAPFVLFLSARARVGTAADEQAIRALNEVFAEGFVKKDAKLRASIWTKDGTVAPPTGGFFQGRDAIEKDFQQETAAVTNSSRMTFSNYRFRFITRDCRFRGRRPHH